MQIDLQELMKLYKSCANEELDIVHDGNAHLLPHDKQQTGASNEVTVYSGKPRPAKKNALGWRYF
jgi:hypothetical protein